MGQGEIIYNKSEKTYLIKYENGSEQKCSNTKELVFLLGEDFEVAENGQTIKSKGMEFKLTNPSIILENIMNYMAVKR